MNTPTAPATGRVYLVGAGPGDPELLTLRAARLLASADVLVYDNLVSDGVLALANPKAERIYAGKRRNEHTLRQEHFEVVPGITAASGVACYAGIPLTHRDHAQSCLFVTGHLKDGNPELEWAALVRAQQTVVIYMGLSALPEICKQLIAHGAPAARPIALVQHGTLATQRVLTGTLADLPAKAEGGGFSSPSLLIVGDVVQLHGTLDWFDTHQGAQTRLTHDEAAQLPPLPISGEKT
jgi:siroheme synthase